MRFSLVLCLPLFLLIPVIFSFVSSDYPFLCMAYKIPDNLQVDAIVNIVGFGWRSISLISGVQEHRIAFLTDWSNGEYANDIIADDT